MKTLAKWLFLLLVYSVWAIGKPVCSVVEDWNFKPVAQGKLTPTWAYHRTGALLARKLVQSDIKEKGLTAPTYGLFDINFQPEELNTIEKPTNNLASDFRSSPSIRNEIERNGTALHGTEIAEVINGSPYGISYPSKIGAYFNISQEDFYYSELPTLIKSGLIPNLGLYNFSVWLGNDEPEAIPALTQLAQKNILVVASGNDWPRPLQKNESLLADKIILVGNLGPSGYPHFMSTEDPKVVLSAPSGFDGLYSRFEDGTDSKNDRIHQMGGTSGSAAQVTAALNLVRTYWKKLDREDAFQLLTRTAVKTPGTAEPNSTNGTGMLNTLKLVAIAKRLHESNLSENEMKAELQKPESKYFDFSKESDQALRKGSELLALPDSEENCPKKKEGFELIETSFLLRPNEKARNLLADTYRALNRPIDRIFYENLDLSDSLTGFQRVLEVKDEYVRLDGLRMALCPSQNLKNNIGLVSALCAPISSEPSLHGVMVESGRILKGRLTDSEKIIFLDSLQQSENPEIRKLAPSFSLRMRVNLSRTLLRAFSDPTEEVWESTLSFIPELPYTDDFTAEDLRPFAEHRNPKVQEATVSVAAYMGKESQTLYWETFLSSPHPEVRAEAIGYIFSKPYFDSHIVPLYRAEISNPKLASAMAERAHHFQYAPGLALLYKNPDETIRNTAIRYAHRLGIPSIANLLIQALNDPSYNNRSLAARSLLEKGIDNRRQSNETYNFFRTVSEPDLQRAQFLVIQMIASNYKYTETFDSLWIQKKNWIRSYAIAPWLLDRDPETLKSLQSLLEEIE